MGAAGLGAAQAPHVLAMSPRHCRNRPAAGAARQGHRTGPKLRLSHARPAHPAPALPLPYPQVLAVVREASAAIKAPIVMFTYFNPIMARGLDKFCRQAKEAGASGACTGAGAGGEGWVPGAGRWGLRVAWGPTSSHYGSSEMLVCCGLRPAPMQRQRLVGPAFPAAPHSARPSRLPMLLQACWCPTSRWRRLPRSARCLNDCVLFCSARLPLALLRSCRASPPRPFIAPPCF